MLVRIFQFATAVLLSCSLGLVAQSVPDAPGNADETSWGAAEPVGLLDDPVDHGSSSTEDDRSCVHLAYNDLAEDPRTRDVSNFLEKHSCPIAHLAPSFVLAAELNDLDYRLLPTLAVLESGCGRATTNHNLFGWANGRKAFGSFEQAIHFVAQRLRLAPHYRNKTTIEKLRLYNRRASYRAKVLRVMESIGDTDEGNSVFTEE